MSNPVLHAAGKGMAAIIGLPYFIFSAMTTLPMWGTAELIRSKVKDKAFRNTVSFGIKLVLTTILFPIYAALAFCFTPWWLAVILLILWSPAYGYFYDYIEGCRRFISEIRLLRNKKPTGSGEHASEPPLAVLSLLYTVNTKDEFQSFKQ